MRKFYKLFLLIGFILPFLVQAQTVTIGTGVTSSYAYGPYYRSSAGSTFNYSKYAYIYTPDELTAIPPGSIITMIEWEKASGTLAANNTFEVLMANNSATVLTTGTSWGTVTAGSTSVYSSTTQGFTATAPGWESFTLGTTFTYTGGTLQIMTDHVKAGVASAANNYYYTPQAGKAIGWSAGTAGSAATLLQTATYGNSRPNIRITYIPGASCSGTPEAGTTNAASTSVCPSIPVSLTLGGATAEAGLTYQWQSSADGVSYTNIAAATNASYTSTQAATTYYQCIVTCTSSGLQDISTPIMVTTNSFLNCYCTSNATNTLDEEILNVSVGTMSNSSTCATTGGPGSTLNLYSDYTALTPTILAATATYNFSVQIGTCGGNYTNAIKIFVDFNQNGTFGDPGETVYTSPASISGPHTETGTFTIPATATIGITKMRVVNVETTLPANINACGTYSWGETEDYLVNIAPIPTCPQPTGITLVSSDLTTATLQWTAGGSETEWQIEYGPVGFTPGTGTFVTTTSNPYTITALAQNSFYTAYVRGICTPGDSSYWAGPISWNTYDQDQYMDWDNACPVAGFIDISTSGTALNTTDDSEVGVTLPFTFLYQGVLMNQITVGNNGGIVLGTLGGAVAYTMPATGSGLYPYTQDMNTPYDNVYIDTIGTTPNRQFIVMWSDLAHYSSALLTDGTTFEVILDEATQEIYFVYDDVIHSPGTATYDNGGDAEIGVRGPNQNINVSMNNTNYLQNNTCAHFFYTDCPKPTSFTISYITADEAAITWSAGLAAETNWTVIYGPDGFDPLTSGTTITTTVTGATFPMLDQLTQYDVYIYADCNPSLQSNSLEGTFLTLPWCSNPSNMANTTEIDSLLTSWTWTATNVDYPSQSFNIQYGMNGFDLYSEGTTISVDNNLTDTLADASLLAGGVYQIYIQAVCTDVINGGIDTSSYVGPFNVTMPITNDTVCGAEMINADGTVYTFNNTGATVTTGEAVIAPPATGAQTTTGWITSTLNNTTWFTFVAPPSGNIRINNTAINYAGQSAIYESINCSNYSNFSLISANDNAIGGTSNAANYTVCGLTPGATYYLLADGNSSTAGNYSISIIPINLNAGAFGELLNICTGDTANLFNGIAGYDQGGLWTAELATVGTGVTDSLFASAGFAYTTFNFEYRLTEGCAYDTVIAQIQVYAPSSAGIDGNITVCKNEPFDLLSGLNGNIDMGGTWYNPGNQVMPSSFTTASNIPGSFNYDYITGNGVCPNDTSNVLVNVLPSCDYLNVQEMAFGSMSIYPNPTNGIVYISNEGSSDLFSYQVTDLEGRIVSTSLPVISGTSVTEIDLNGKVTGLYLIRVFNESSEKVFRIVLQ